MMISLTTIWSLSYDTFIVARKPPSVNVRKMRTGILHGYCKYLASDGGRCAVGLALPDSVVEDANSAGAFDTLVDHPSFEHLFDDRIHTMCQGDLLLFQRELHDDIRTPRGDEWKYGRTEMRKSYIGTAAKFGCGVIPC